VAYRCYRTILISPFP